VIEVLGYRLQGAATLPGPVTEMALELSGLIAAGGRQAELPGMHRRQPSQLAEASRRLKQQYGEPVLFRVVEVEPWSRIPERRRALIAYDP
jgi:DNA polymerase-4/protein ImuB